MEPLKSAKQQVIHFLKSGLIPLCIALALASCNSPGFEAKIPDRAQYVIKLDPTNLALKLASPEVFLDLLSTETVNQGNVGDTNLYHQILDSAGIDFLQPIYAYGMPKLNKVGLINIVALSISDPNQFERLIGKFNTSQKTIVNLEGVKSIAINYNLDIAWSKTYALLAFKPASNADNYTNHLRAHLNAKAKDGLLKKSNQFSDLMDSDHDVSIYGRPSEWPEKGSIAEIIGSLNFNKGAIDLEVGVNHLNTEVPIGVFNQAKIEQVLNLPVGKVATAMVFGCNPDSLNQQIQASNQVAKVLLEQYAQMLGSSFDELVKMIDGNVGIATSANGQLTDYRLALCLGIRDQQIMNDLIGKQVKDNILISEGEGRYRLNSANLPITLIAQPGRLVFGYELAETVDPEYNKVIESQKATLHAHTLGSWVDLEPFNEYLTKPGTSLPYPFKNWTLQGDVDKQQKTVIISSSIRFKDEGTNSFVQLLKDLSKIDPQKAPAYNNNLLNL